MEWGNRPITFQTRLLTSIKPGKQIVTQRSTKYEPKVHKWFTVTSQIYSEIDQSVDRLERILRMRKGNNHPSVRVGEWVSERVSDWVSDWVSEWVSEWVIERVSVCQWVSQWVDQWVSEWVGGWLKTLLKYLTLVLVTEFYSLWNERWRL